MISPKKISASSFFFILFLFLLIQQTGFTQTPRTLVVTANFKVEEGNYEGSYMVLENITTGEKQTLKGQSRFNVNLKFNNDYILSFSKPKYITKKIQINTATPAERIEQGFYPVTFNVVLFKQYEVMNIVIFNQPVSKYKFSKLLDDFNYDTDYTKQVQSALKNAEEELKKKKEEEKQKVEQAKKDTEKAKQDSIANAKTIAQGKQDSIAASKLAAVKAEEERKAKAKADEEVRQQVKAKEAEEARQQLKIKADEEARQKLTAKTEEEERRKLKEQQDAETKSVALKQKQEEDERKKLLAKQEEEEKRKAAAKAKEEEEAKRTAKVTVGNESRPEKIVEKKSPVHEINIPEKSEELPAVVNVEEITEKNRTITKATVTKDGKQSVYTKVVYAWGGIYYFHDNVSISENLFRMETNLK